MDELVADIDVEYGQGANQDLITIEWAKKLE
jgi:hypothetical protein